MANDDATRPDGSVIVGLSRSEWEKYKERYHHHISDEELIHIIDFNGSIIDDNGSRFDKGSFELCANYIKAQREQEKNNGKRGSLATSLFMLLSVHVKRKKSSSLSVFGEITSVSGYGKKDYLYKRESHEGEEFSESDDGVFLSLNGPPDSCSAEEACLIFGSKKLSIRLYNQPGQLLIDVRKFVLDYSPDDFEHVKDKVVENNEVTLTLKYVSIPMALYGFLDIRISKREGYKKSPKFLDVCGKVVAKYKNTFGNYDSEEIVLFDKDPGLDQYKSVHLDMRSNLLSSSRCWLVAPACSLLHLHIHLFDSEKKIILTEDDAQLETDNSYRSFKEFIIGDYFISVSSIWRDAFRLPKDGCHDQIYRSLEKWTPVMEPAVEVFSVIVCTDKSTPFQIHGRLQFNTLFASEDFIDEGFDIFRIEKEDPLTLLGRGNSIPLLNGGSRELPNFLPVSIICDLEDTTGGLNTRDTTGRLSIKGYQTIRDECWFDRQLCSIFRGDHGFAAVHFAIFSSAGQAHLDVLVQRKGSQCSVFGSICARYEAFHYPSKYKQNWYSIVFFKKSREELVRMDADGSIPLGRDDLVQMDADGADGSIPLGRDDLVQMDADGLISRFSIPLSRSSFVVPSYSSCRFYLDLTIDTEKITREITIASDTPTMIIEGAECKVVLKCSEVM